MNNREVNNISNNYSNLITDSDSETEDNQCQIKPPGKFKVDFELDKNENLILIIPMKDSSIRPIEFNQTREEVL